MDEELWATGRDEGYVGCPPLLDGGLQIFLSYLLNASHLFAIPQRAERTTFVRPPTGPRVTCHVTRPSDDWMDANERGQYSVQRGERAAGAITFYDSDTGHLIAHIGLYTYFTSNPRWNDLPKTKHEIVWQPKFVPEGKALRDRLPEGEIEPAALIAALERADGDEGYGCHVAEFAGSREPDDTILADCLDHLTGAGRPVRVLAAERRRGGDGGPLRRLRSAGRRAPLPVPSIRPPSPRRTRDSFAPAASRSCSCTGRTTSPAPPAGPSCGTCAWREGWRWSPTRTATPSSRATAGPSSGPAAPPPCCRRRPSKRAEPGERPLPGPRWVLGGPTSWASDWTALLDAPETVQPIPHEAVAGGRFESLEAWSRADEVRAIDFFCGADPDDPTGEMATEHFVGFVQALVSVRLANANHVCRVSVVTHRAALDVEHPRGSALWGAVRSMAMEVGDEAGLDFRLVDLGDADDLWTLAWLARCDLRERELAVRENRLWAPRISSIRKRYPTRPAGDDAAYRLTLDDPGQIAGLEMKTYELPSPGPDDVEIEVDAAALNFRDVMVTLGLLPALAYERSALGREVGMEGSGTVRRIGSKVRHCAVGDRVAFIAGGCIANRVLVPEYLVFAKPDRLGMEEAASTLSVYVTAYYSLIHLARLGKGQRVLIHSAMGGVGQAAIALARHVGRRDLHDGRQRRQARATPGDGRAGGLRFAQPRLVRRPDGGDRRRGCGRGPELPGRAAHRALSAGAPPRRLALRNRQDRHLRRQRPRSAHLPEEPSLRGHRRGPSDGRRPAPHARTLGGLHGTAGPGCAAATPGHRLPVPGLRQGPAPDDDGRAPGANWCSRRRETPPIPGSRSRTSGRSSIRMQPIS